MNNSEKLLVYSTSWCPDCHRSKALLDRYKVPYVEIDIEKHPDAVPIVLHVNEGMKRVPTIVFPDGSTMTEPSDKQLATKLKLV